MSGRERRFAPSRIRPRRMLSLLAAFVLASLAAAYALEVPYLSGRVNDEAHVLSPSVVTELESLLKAYEDSTGNQIAVLIIPSLEGESLEEYSLRVAETWKLGKKGVDNGALLLIAKNDRKLRIEVGYGLEASLTDAACSFIISEVITPRFKSGDFDGGVREGVVSMIKAADGTLDTTASSSSSFADVTGILIFCLIWFGVIGVFTLVALFSDGAGSWILYGFLALFYAGGSLALGSISSGLGWGVFLGYMAGFPLLRWAIRRTEFGKKHTLKWQARSGSASAWSSGSSSSGWSSSGSSYSSGGGSSFSGGGGSFGGGGSSGSW